ncbi:hypothetical protein DH86_00002267, partial [Scytalidium sp. 3C]
DEEGNYKLPQNEVVTIKQELIGLMDLVARLTPDNAKVNNGVLEVAHSIFKRWRPLFQSDDLYTEINHVLSKFGEPFVKLLIVRSLSSALGFPIC